MIFPSFNSIGFAKVMFLNFLYQKRNVILRIFQILDTYDPSKYNATFIFKSRSVSLVDSILIMMDNTRTVDKKNALLQIDKLPHFGFARNRCSFANFFVAKGIDDRAFSYVRVTDKTDGDLLFVGVKTLELAKDVDE